MKLDAYSIIKTTGFTKSPAVMAVVGNRSFLLMYLRRPKWIKSDDCWDTILDSIIMKLPTELGITYELEGN